MQKNRLLRIYGLDMGSGQISSIHCVGKSDVGVKRSANEDTFVVRPELGLFVVADGMGGALAGEVASEMAVETLGREMTRRTRGLALPGEDDDGYGDVLKA